MPKLLNAQAPNLPLSPTSPSPFLFLIMALSLFLLLQNLKTAIKFAEKVKVSESSRAALFAVKVQSTDAMFSDALHPSQSTEDVLTDVPVSCWLQSTFSY